MPKRNFRYSKDRFDFEYHSLDSCLEFCWILTHTLQVRLVSVTAYEVIDQVPGADPGITIIMIFLESSLSLHTWPGEKKISLDIVSCKKFDKLIVDKAFRLFSKGRIVDVLGN